ncbi:hypothetical protein TL16_g04124 [Triparma laevis f. inornata]|uniref:Uncharacterized protein n=2 Tax=Triparma laevis TaxID=1534972 RepID=A0A9W7KV68_9STRA|nr:hypothetical protein TL16_g04124 [Triparma laevis f. inornata]GMI12872.1 hypothetical protein TrLO_g3683 [Triparma laevis f. longispina]
MLRTPTLLRPIITLTSSHIKIKGLLNLPKTQYSISLPIQILLRNTPSHFSPITGQKTPSSLLASGLVDSNLAAPLSPIEFKGKSRILSSSDCGRVEIKEYDNGTTLSFTVPQGENKQ